VFFEARLFFIIQGEMIVNPFKNDWKDFFDVQSKEGYYLALREFLIKEYREEVVFPNMYHIFDAMKCTSLADTKVVILGQDPYHNPGQAHGFSFSVPEGIKIPPSLVNVYKELHDDLGIKKPKTGCLIPWAEQGVLLLNTVLTVRGGTGMANSHKGHGWEKFTDAVIKLVGAKEEPVVFILWGNPAIKKRKLISNPKHLVLTSPHPSPLSADRGFFGSKPFSKTNKFLESVYGKSIEWSL
jgi:uracil-DNA glycosylase